MMADWGKSLGRFWAKGLSFDLRSLALFRMGLALAVMVRLWQLNMGVGGWLVGAIAALLMLIGYRTRWATLVVWLLLLLVSRSITDIGAVLLWAMFLPLGSSYAIDQALNTSPRPQPQQVFTAANLGLLLQLGLMAAGLPQTAGLLAVTALVLIPQGLWDRCTAFTPQQLGLKIYYDADCGFCKKIVHLLRTFLVLPQRIPLQIAQSDPIIHTAMETHNSWVIVDWQGQHHYKWHGIAYVVSLSPILWPLAPILRWSPLMAVGNRIYETIANNRRFAGNFTKPFKFQSFTAESPRLLNLALWCLLLGVTLHQVARLIP